MKIIQSFWSKPFLLSKDSLTGSRLHGGWPLKKYNYYSWALSCLQLSKYYDSVELITDELGKYLLIDKLNLPYKHVRVKLDQLDRYDPALWALGKIYAYSIQEEPFLHVDNDVFIWNRFDERITKGRLVAQNKEMAVREYARTFEQVRKGITYLPECLKALTGSLGISCCNAGILGGMDLGFFKRYTTEVFSFLNNNMERLLEKTADIHLGNLNILYEQVIFYRLAYMRNLAITYLFPDCDRTPKYLGDFTAMEKNAGFVHALSFYKSRRLVYSLLEIRLRTLYPREYAHINRLVDTREI